MQLRVGGTPRAEFGPQNDEGEAGTAIPHNTHNGWIKEGGQKGGGGQEGSSLTPQAGLDHLLTVAHRSAWRPVRLARAAHQRTPGPAPSAWPQTTPPPRSSLDPVTRD